MQNNRFVEIYSNDEWSGGSGEGSFDFQTKGYQGFLQNFISKNNIKSVVDMGCGDWQFSQYIDWSGVRYQGYDVVPSVVTSNANNFSAANISFTLYSGDPNDLPSGDLLIVKDVLQHLSNQSVLDVTNCLFKYKYALLTNCINPKGKTINEDINTGDFRYLDLRLAPFSLNAVPIYSFKKRDNNLLEKVKTIIRGYSLWEKIVLLVDNTSH
jgi:SAM-dependent methyltransferase